MNQFRLYELIGDTIQHELLAQRLAIHGNPYLFVGFILLFQSVHLLFM